ncbi:hypothetical protein HYG81_21460 (plasmid) [Natrinema zhouii]|uniref:hypothetical protein n=1 Tax=Natrinema zhouii TaxID=1710539 RepID=UPI001CFFE59D|nr:hypothetical protein [Natrinema zhouii]UHQ98145.1 hypothetical protein HYG81_21460 [Natrinema zhouii]
MPTMENDSKFWRLVAKYRRSKRGEMLLSLNETARNSSDIADRIDVSTNTSGNYLREAKQDGIVECVTPESDRYRMYSLTDLGQDIAREL